VEHLEEMSYDDRKRGAIPGWKYGVDRRDLEPDGKSLVAAANGVRWIESLAVGIYRILSSGEDIQTLRA
jgi:hypothetical protein